VLRWRPEAKLQALPPAGPATLVDQAGTVELPDPVGLVDLGDPANHSAPSSFGRQLSGRLLAVDCPA